MSALQSLLEIGPQLVHVFEPDAEPQQVHRHAVAFPAMARLHGRLDAAEARGVLDQARRGLDLSRISVDVEREQAAEAGIAHFLDLGMVLKPARELPGGLRLALDADIERLEAAEQEIRGVG